MISRPVVINDKGAITFDDGGQGTVLTLRTSGASVRGLHITRSGGSHDAIDSGLLIDSGSDNVIEGNTIDDVLFGITLQRANNNRIIGNRIPSRPDEPADRGDGIRLWYSMSSRVENNDISRIRDITITNSLRNRFVANSVSDGPPSAESPVLTPQADREEPVDRQFDRHYRTQLGRPHHP